MGVLLAGIVLAVLGGATLGQLSMWALEQLLDVDGARIVDLDVADVRGWELLRGA